MNYSVFSLIALILAGSTLSIGMEQSKYPIRLPSGQYDEDTHTTIMNLISGSTLKEASADIRALAHSKQKYYKLLNTPYNTRVLIRELANRYTNKNFAKAARELNTRGVLPMLAEKELEITPPAISRPTLNLSGIYFSRLPIEVSNTIFSLYQRGQSKAEKLRITQKYIKKRFIKDNFNTIEELASTLESYETNRKASLLAAAQLLNTPKSKWWISLVQFSASEQAIARFICGKFYIEELKIRKLGLPLLEYAAAQLDNKSVCQEAQDFLYKFDSTKYKRYGPAQPEEQRGPAGGGSYTRTEYYKYRCYQCKAWFNEQHYPHGDGF